MSTGPHTFAVSDLMPLAAAARLLPPRRAGRPTSPSTLFRWATRGVHGVRLKTWRLGRNLLTTSAALEAFIQESTAAVETANSDAAKVPSVATDRLTERTLRQAGLVEE